MSSVHLNKEEWPTWNDIFGSKYVSYEFSSSQGQKSGHLLSHSSFIQLVKQIRTDCSYILRKNIVLVFLLR